MDVLTALRVLEEHVVKHSNNKYQNTILNTDKPLEEPRFTLLTANKYMARYLAHSGEKQGQIEDLLKCAHFILFEIQNRLNQQAAATNKDQLSLKLEDMKGYKNASRIHPCFPVAGAERTSDYIPPSQIGNILVSKPLSFEWIQEKGFYYKKINGLGFFFGHNTDGQWQFATEKETIYKGEHFTQNDADRIAAYLKM